MGRIRTIKPEFHSHEELSALPAETHLLAAALVNYADDHGYFNANPILVKAGTNPLRADKTVLEAQLEQLERIGYIEIRREGIKHYGRITNFDSHQRVSHATDSKLESKFELLPKSSRNIPEPLRPEGNREGKGIEQGTGNREAVTAVPASPIFITLPMLDKKFHIITEADVSNYEQGYPGVDVRKELRKIIPWLDAHPENMSKTITGNKQRIVRWLTRTQNEGGSRGSNQRNSTVEKQQISHNSITAALERRLGAQTSEHDGPGAGFLPQPDPSPRDARPVVEGMGGDGGRDGIAKVRDGIVEGFGDRALHPEP